MKVLSLALASLVASSASAAAKKGGRVRRAPTLTEKQATPKLMNRAIPYETFLKQHRNAQIESFSQRVLAGKNGNVAAGRQLQDEFEITGAHTIMPTECINLRVMSEDLRECFRQEEEEEAEEEEAEEEEAEEENGEDRKKKRRRLDGDEEEEEAEEEQAEEEEEEDENAYLCNAATKEYPTVHPISSYMLFKVAKTGCYSNDYDDEDEDGERDNGDCTVYNYNADAEDENDEQDQDENGDEWVQGAYGNVYIIDLPSWIQYVYGEDGMIGSLLNNGYCDACNECYEDNDRRALKAISRGLANDEKVEQVDCDGMCVFLRCFEDEEDNNNADEGGVQDMEGMDDILGWIGDMADGCQETNIGFGKYQVNDDGEQEYDQYLNMGFTCGYGGIQIGYFADDDCSLLVNGENIDFYQNVVSREENYNANAEQEEDENAITLNDLQTITTILSMPYEGIDCSADEVQYLSPNAYAEWEEEQANEDNNDEEEENEEVAEANDLCQNLFGGEAISLGGEECAGEEEDENNNGDEDEEEYGLEYDIEDAEEVGSACAFVAATAAANEYPDDAEDAVVSSMSSFGGNMPEYYAATSIYTGTYPYYHGGWAEEGSDDIDRDYSPNADSARSAGSGGLAPGAAAIIGIIAGIVIAVGAFFGYQAYQKKKDSKREPLTADYKNGTEA